MSHNIMPYVAAFLAGLLTLVIVTVLLYAAGLLGGISFIIIVGCTYAAVQVVLRKYPSSKKDP